MERLETISADAYLSVSTPVQVAALELLKGTAIRAQIQQRARDNFVALSKMASHYPSCSILTIEAGWHAVMQGTSRQVRRDDRARRP